MRKNTVKKRKNIFEVLGIKQNNKKWLVLILTIVLTGYLLFSLIYAPMACIRNVTASAESESEYQNIYTTNNKNQYIVELPTIYFTQYNRFTSASTSIKYVMNTNYEELIVQNPLLELDYVERYIIAENYEENENGTYVGLIEICAIKNNIENQNEYIEYIPDYLLYRRQKGQINLTEINFFNIIQDMSDTEHQIKFRIIKDENNYIEYWFDASRSTYRPYWDIQNQIDFEMNKGIFVYKDRNEITGQLSKDYWKQYFINTETFKDTYKDYWYDYYYQSIYNEGLRAGETYSTTSFYTLIDAITFGAIKPIYSILNFNLLGINLWNLATSIFTVLIVIIIIKFIGMVI